MKHFFSYLTCIAAIVGCMLCSGCETDVDLGNIDMSTAVKADLALPIGSIRAELGDFLGEGVIENLSIDENGCYVYCDTFYTRKSFHTIDLTSYLSNTHKVIDIHQHLVAQQPELGWLPYIPLPADTTFYMDFVLPFEFSEFNSDVYSQRIDSMIISQAKFNSKIGLNGLSSLKWDEISKIELILNPETFRRDEMAVNIPVQGYGFGVSIPILVDDFNLILMKDAQAAPSMQNVINSTSFTLRFHFHTKRAHQITSAAKLEYDLEVDFLDYDAVFGYFKASNLMRDERKDVALSEYWSGWSELDGFMLPVREPSVFLGIEHAIAVPLVLELQELSLKDKEGQEKYMSFNGEKSKKEFLAPNIQVTDPLTAHSFDTIWLDYTAANGNLADVMTIHPEYLSYSYRVDADSTYDMPQYRLVDDTDIHLSIGVEIPFKFNPGTKVFFADTLENLQIDQLSLDSLIANVEVIETVNDAKLSLFLSFENYIPFAVNAELEFLDETGQVIEFDGLKDIELAYPDIENHVAVSPGKAQVEISVSYNDLDKLAAIRSLRYALSLGDNTDAVDMREDAALKIFVGVKANVDMVLDLNSLFGE